jgi:hypothetical protein
VNSLCPSLQSEHLHKVVIIKLFDIQWAVLAAAATCNVSLLATSQMWGLLRAARRQGRDEGKCAAVGGIPWREYSRWMKGQPAMHSKAWHTLTAQLSSECV